MAKVPAGKQGQDDLVSELSAVIAAAFEPLGKIISSATLAATQPLRVVGSWFQSKKSKSSGTDEGEEKKPSRPGVGSAISAATGAPGKALSGLVAGFGKGAAAALLPLTAALELFKTAASGATQQIYSFVSKANPAAAFQFDRALDDLAGTMGQILTPILEASTGFIREFADVLQGLRPALEPIMGTIGEVIGELARLIEPIAQGLVPVLGVVGAVISDLLLPIMHEFVDVIILVVGVLSDAIENLSAGLISMGKIAYKKGDSVGAAVRPASYSKIEERGKRTTLAALNVGRSSLTPDGTAITDRQDKGNSLLGEIKNLLTNAGEFRKTGDSAMQGALTAAMRAAATAD